MINSQSLEALHSAISSATTPTTVMGPECLTEPRIGSMPPTWDGVSKPFRLYLEELLNWKDFTTLVPERRAPAAIIRLSGEPKNLALTIKREDGVKNNGLEKIVEKFKDVYSETEEQDLYFYYKQFSKFRRTPNQSISDFIGGFTSRADMLKSNDEVKIPEKLLAMMMIDHASLTDEQENNLFGASGG